MSAWVYLVSQFSHEALLFEALLIFGLIIVYSTFWLLSKRRYGSVKTAVPSGVVKAHLNELIQDAEKLRAQLFGILYQGGGETPLSTGEPSVSVHPSHAPSHFAPASASADPDPQLGQRISELEAKIKEQLSVISKVETDKSALAAEIEKLKSIKPAESSGGGGGDVDGLKAKLKELEDRLEEYSIIEDDLANLKRLQQENAALKKQIAAGGAATPTAATPVAAAAVAEAAVASPSPAPEAQAAAPAAPVAEVAAANPSAASPTDAQLGALASDVEKSIASAVTPAASPEPAVNVAPPADVAAAPAAPAGASAVDPSAAATPAATQAAAPAEPPKADADDLLKEFEKMLNS